ncbi:hypothetical protein PQQ87_08195 [Paraburkholderia nemoris]|uniref:hypothetical protein n=1 Tax=Paraburkholderia nemoris TaxID=2793076 RepID=UPI0038BD8F4D
MSTPIDISDAELDELMGELETEAAAMINKAQSEPQQQPGAVQEAPVLNAEIAQQDHALDAASYFTPEELAPVTEVPLPVFPADVPPPETVVNDDAKAAALAALKGKKAEPAPAPVVEQPQPTPEPVVPPTVEPAPKLEQVAPPLDPLPVQPKVSPSGLEDIDLDEFRRETRVTELNLHESAMNQHGYRAYYGAQAARMEAQYERVKLLMDVLESRLYKKHRTAILATGEKATEKMIEADVQNDPDYIKARQRLIEAKEVAERWRSASNSMVDRRSMIELLAYDRRHEMKGQLRVMGEGGANPELAQMKEAALSALRAG